MPLPTTAGASSVASATHLRRQPPLSSPHLVSFRNIASSLPIQRRLSCHVTINSSASPSDKIGRKVRVKGQLKVHHVAKLPELDLGGMIGVVKQYAGIWKGRRITPNLPFKVEFLKEKDGLSAPVKFFAHLREGEFEYVLSDEDQF